MKVLILGASGMIGRAMCKVLSKNTDWTIIASVRARVFSNQTQVNEIAGIDLANVDNLAVLFRKAKPDVVINCAGLTKHLPEGNDPIPALIMNALLPNRLVDLCALTGARLIHVSSDCVFSGKKGNYFEQDPTDALDVYGKTKALGEVNGDKVITLRTSTIGHEHKTRFGLLEWFLSQQECKGFSQAVFSGLPTAEFARVVRDVVIPNTSLNGLYHVGAAPIDKLTLLRLIAKTYKTHTNIVADDVFRIDRSLNSEKFFNATGYRAAEWPKLIEDMRNDYIL